MTALILTKEMTYCGSLILVTPEFPLIQLQQCSGKKSFLKSILAETDEIRMQPVLGNPDIALQKPAAAALQNLLADIGCTDEITAVSGYRTQTEQEEIWEDSMIQNGEAFTRKFVAVPGHSEHQTGYAIDLAQNAKEIDFICPEFPRTGIFGRFRERMALYGFVERYAAGKEEITGIGAEPWHFRYVGYPHSVIMAEKGMALEEYIAFLRKCTAWGHPYIFRDGREQIEISYIPLEKECPVSLEIPTQAVCQSSGTNEGGMVVSVRQNLYAEEEV